MRRTMPEPQFSIRIAQSVFIGRATLVARLKAAARVGHDVHRTLDHFVNFRYASN
jgi:hypothetical protein